MHGITRENDEKQEIKSHVIYNNDPSQTESTLGLRKHVLPRLFFSKKQTAREANLHTICARCAYQVVLLEDIVSEARLRRLGFAMSPSPTSDLLKFWQGTVSPLYLTPLCGQVKHFCVSIFGPRSHICLWGVMLCLRRCHTRRGLVGSVWSWVPPPCLTW